MLPFSFIQVDMLLASAQCFLTVAWDSCDCPEQVAMPAASSCISCSSLNANVKLFANTDCMHLLSEWPAAHIDASCSSSSISVYAVSTYFSNQSSWGL